MLVRVECSRPALVALMGTAVLLAAMCFAVLAGMAFYAAAFHDNLRDFARSL